MTAVKCPVQRAARDSLAKSARELRSQRGGPCERQLNWEPGDGYPSDSVCFARAGRGRLILSLYRAVVYAPDGTVEREATRSTGVNYVSSFGPNSERSFSGYLPGLTLEEAKLLVYHHAARHW